MADTRLARHQAQELPVWVTMRQVTQMTQRHERTIRQAIAEGHLPAYKIGREFRFKLEDVEALLRPVPTTGNVD